MVSPENKQVTLYRFCMLHLGTCIHIFCVCARVHMHTVTWIKKEAMNLRVGRGTKVWREKGEGENVITYPLKIIF